MSCQSSLSDSGTVAPWSRCSSAHFVKISVWWEKKPKPEFGPVCAGLLSLAAAKRFSGSYQRQAGQWSSLSSVTIAWVCWLNRQLSIQAHWLTYCLVYRTNNTKAHFSCVKTFLALKLILVQICQSDHNHSVSPSLSLSVYWCICSKPGTLLSGLYIIFSCYWRGSKNSIIVFFTIQSSRFKCDCDLAFVQVQVCCWENLWLLPKWLWLFFWSVVFLMFIL